jgi:hypothetical protein
MEVEHKARKPVSSVQFWVEIEQIIPPEEMKSESVWVPSEGRTKRLRLFPSRPTARKRWEKHAKQKVDWPEDVEQPSAIEPEERPAWENELRDEG